MKNITFFMGALFLSLIGYSQNGGDICSEAVALTCGKIITGDTEGATASGLPATCGLYTSTDQQDLFYSFEADGTSDYVVSLSQPEGAFRFDGVLFVYSGSCGSLTSLGCSDSGDPEEMELLAPPAGTYIVRIFDYAGTAPFTLELRCIDPSLSVKDTNMLAETHLFPNPLNDSKFYVHAPKLNGKRVEVNIVDMAGRQIYNEALNCDENKVAISISEDLTSGLYLVTLKHADEAYTYRLLKE